jgi:outer membrane cobalamin receptor
VNVRSIFAFLVTILLAPLAFAGPLTGRVLDPDGRPVAGARVLAVAGTATVAIAATNSRGEFVLNAPDTGALEVRVALEGFRAEPVRIDGASQSRALGDLKLQISAVSESVVVSAAQVETPLSQAASSITVMSGAELQQRQIHTVADALREVPGMTVVRYGSMGALTNVFPRGGESDYTLVIVDGIQANSFGGEYDFGHLSTENVDRIEVVRGPQSALFGSNAIGSVVRLQTKRGGPVAGSGTFEGGSFGTLRTSASTSGSSGGWDWGAAGEHLASDGFNGSTTAAGQTVANDDYTRSLGAFSAGWHSTGNAVVRGDVRVSRDERGFPGPFGTNPIGAYDGIDTVSRGTNDRVLASIGGIVPVNARLRVQGQLTHGRLDTDFASPFGPSESSSRRTAIRGQADVTVSSTFDVSAGIDYQRERARSTFITDASGEIPIDRSVAAYFGEARWRSTDRLFVTAGIRIDDIERDVVPADPFAFAPRPEFPADSVVSTNPRVAVAWFVRGQSPAFTKVRGSVGTGIRPPDGLEIAFTDNPSLKPERSRSADFGIDQAVAGGRGLLEFTAFFNNYDDMIVAVGDFTQSSHYRTDNISNARARGIELAGTARGTAGHASLQVRAGYTFLDTEILAVDRAGSAPPPFEIGDPLLRRPRSQFFADFLVGAGRFSAYLQAGGRSRALDIEPTYGSFGGLFYSPGYQRWNAGASFRIYSGIEAFARIDNLFDREYEEAFGFPALGRGAFAGLRVAGSR